MDKKEILINKIREAFNNVKLEGGIGLNEAQGIDDYEDAQTRKKLRDKDEKENWEAIPSSELNRCNSSLSFFDPKGMRFHLPAFMIALLSNEYNFGLVFTLTNVSRNSKTQLYSKSQFSDLTKEQREVIKAFLEYLLEDDEYEYERDQIKYALDNYWQE